MCCLQLRSVAESLYQHRELSIWEAQCKQRGSEKRFNSNYQNDMEIFGNESCIRSTDRVNSG
jgi:hypothetical protein